MTTISSFVNRLKKIGIDVRLVSNFPWVYMETVNGKKVQGKFLANHGFTCFFQPVRADQVEHITDISKVFKKIRQTLNGIKCSHCNGDLHFIDGGHYDEDYYTCHKCKTKHNPEDIDN